MSIESKRRNRAIWAYLIFADYGAGPALAIVQWIANKGQTSEVGDFIVDKVMNDYLDQSHRLQSGYLPAISCFAAFFAAELRADLSFGL